jgi:hypothetical protein
MPFKKGDKPGPGRPRKGGPFDPRRHQQDTIANAIRHLETVIEELEHGHRSLREGLAIDSVIHVMAMLQPLTTAAARRRSEPPALDVNC